MQLQLISDFFISQLIRSRHPGAFELTASGFQSFCEILLKWVYNSCKLDTQTLLLANILCFLIRAKDYENVSQWPEQWLSVVIADLTDSIILPVTTEIGNLPIKCFQDTTLCATRRSAGLPFFVQVRKVQSCIVPNQTKLGTLCPISSKKARRLMLSRQVWKTLVIVEMDKQRLD